MKGVIVQCLENLIKEKFGKEKWEAALVDAGLAPNTIFLATEDIDDSSVLQVIGSLCKILNISLTQAADAFGEYWVNVFAPKVYNSFYIGVNSAKEFLQKMDDVHRLTTNTIPNAKPPRFDYEWKDDRTLIMTYNSGRGLIDFFIGLVKGVGKYYNENLDVQKLATDKIEVTFAS